MIMMGTYMIFGSCSDVYIRRRYHYFISRLHLLRTGIKRATRAGPLESCTMAEQFSKLGLSIISLLGALVIALKLGFSIGFQPLILSELYKSSNFSFMEDCCLHIFQTLCGGNTRSRVKRFFPKMIPLHTLHIISLHLLSASTLLPGKFLTSPGHESVFWYTSI